MSCSQTTWNELLSSVFSLILLKRGEKELGGREIVCFVVLVVEENLLGTESLGGRNGVAGVTLDNVRHLVNAFSGLGR
jgi:hypothetical protein